MPTSGSTAASGVITPPSPSIVPPISTPAYALLLEEFQYPDDFSVQAKTAVGDILLFYNDKLSMGPRLQYLYAKRHIVQLILQNVWQNVTWAEAGVQESDGQQSDHMQKLYDSLTAEILLLESRIAANRGGAIGVITATAPIMPRNAFPPFSTLPDPNGRMYRGDPFVRGFRR